ncbi:FAD-dependent oxidoreductase, partial [Myxococcota bacterium]|nr:FAD-dependent oxidoreductase [Myxococcota bacterium]
MNPKKVLIVGAGPGGLTAAMILASKGYRVEVFEKSNVVGGRNAPLRLGPYTFDTGPTFLMMRHILDEVFAITGRKSEDYLKCTEVDPMYRLRFGDGREFFPTRDPDRMKAQMEALFPGSFAQYQKYMKREKVKYERLVPCLQKPYGKISDHFHIPLLKALPYLDLHTDLFSYLGKYFSHDDLRISFTFQAKYLGMSPWQCPATFSIISYIEHGLGIWHVEGGLNQISTQMANVLKEEGGTLHLSTPVSEVLVENGKARGLVLESGERVMGDYVIINADFAHAMTHLVHPRHR